MKHLLKTPREKLTDGRTKGKHYFRLLFAIGSCYPHRVRWVLAEGLFMDKQRLFQFLDSCGLGVLSSLGSDGAPQSALVGIAVTQELEIVFDTVAKSRKFANIARDPRVAFVAGWQGEVTVQYEGIARLISSMELGPYHEIYFRKFPDGPARLKWEGITYYVVTPKWIRYSDYNQSPPEIVEFSF